jgi:hypothetical protein
MTLFEGLCLLLLSVLSLFVGVGLYQTKALIRNQHGYMKEQFHSAGISLVALFGEAGLKRLSSCDTVELSHVDSFATGLLIQRFIVAYWIRDAFTAEEWSRMVVEDGRTVFASKLVRSRWESVKRWYPNDVQRFIEEHFLYPKTDG